MRGDDLADRGRVAEPRVEACRPLQESTYVLPELAELRDPTVELGDVGTEQVDDVLAG